ncbi:MAG: pilus assembly protein [Eubacteriales bacterium]|nr:pilus assembly protein [Eubacteriales bacterium]
MNGLRIRGMMTVEASIVLAIMVYVILFITDTALFFYDTHMVANEMTRSLLRIQNCQECGTDPDNGTIRPMREDVPLIDKADYIRRAARGKTLRTDIDDVLSEEGIFGDTWTVEARYDGLVWPFRSVRFKRKVYLPSFRPAGAMRRNREIHHVIDGD